MAKVTNITNALLEKRLALTSKQEEAFNALEAALHDVYMNGMGAKEIVVLLQDIGPTVPGEIYQWQPFAFAALYFSDELFSAFMRGDAWARQEATLPPVKPLESFESK
jgi:hypothetical protein